MTSEIHRSLALVCGAGVVFGKETMALELGEGLRETGYSVEYVTSSWNNGDFSNRLEALKFPNYPMRMGFISATLTRECIEMTLDQLRCWPALLIQYRRFMKQTTAQFIIHTNWHHLLLLWLFLKPERDFFWLHENVPDKPQYRKVFRQLAKRLNCFVPVSHSVADSLRNIGIPESKIRVIHNGIRDPAADLAPTSKVERTCRIGVIGQINQNKGHEDLLEAFAQLHVTHPDVELHVFGRGSPHFEDALKARAKTLKLSNRIIWRGFVFDRRDIYKEIDICVVPSRSQDPLPTVAIEAAFFGLPVVGTNRGGMPEIVEDGVTGYLVEARSSNRLAERIEVLVASKKLRKTLGRAARVKAIAEFNRERFIQEFRSLLDETTRFA